MDSISTSKPGKHGSAKCAIVAKNIFNGSRHDEISQAHATVKSPKVTRVMYQVMNIDDDHLELLSDAGDTREDIRCPSNAVSNPRETCCCEIGEMDQRPFPLLHVPPFI